MINTRVSIFKTLHKRIRELTKHGLLLSKDFKKIMMAVILNDMKEWSEYIPDIESNKIVNLLNNVLMHNDFILDRHSDDPMAYMNVNTPQTNSTWKRIWDGEKNLFITAEKQEVVISCEPWEIDPTYQENIIYFYSVNEEGEKIPNLEYLTTTYGVYGEKLKTVHLKMDIYIDRETGNAWYLDNSDCTWKPIGGSTGVTEEDVERMINERKITHSKTDLNAIHAALTTESEVQDIQLATNEDVIV